MKPFVLLFIFFFISVMVFAPTPSPAQDEKEPVVCEGDVVEYLIEEKKVISRGHVVITYKDMKLTCDEATVFLDTNDAIAYGNVTFYEGESILRAEEATYNFDTEKGTMIESEAMVEGEMTTKFWYAKAREGEKVQEKEYRLHRGYITTCELVPPHYRIQSKKVKVYLEDKIVAFHNIFFIENYPLMYLPYYSHSLQENVIRVTFLPGKKKEWGPFTLSKWRYYFNEGSRGYIHLDWMELRGWGEGIDYDYITRDFGYGTFKTYRVADLARHTDPVGRRKRIRHRAKLRHRWQINDDTLLVAEYHRWKDKNVTKDFFFEEEYRWEAQPESFVSIDWSRPGYNLNARFKKRANRFFTVVEELPTLDLDIPKLRLGKTRFYYENTASLSNLNYKIVSQVGESEEDDISLTEDRDVVRFNTYNQLSYVTKLLGWLEAEPYVGWRQLWYSKDSEGDPDLRRGIYYDGLDLSTQFSRIFHFKGSPLGIEINKLRHLIEPSASYYYIRDPTVEDGRLIQIDSTDSLARSTAITLTLENKLQTKRLIEDQMDSVDLVALRISTNYYPAKESPHRISNISGNLELRPYNWLTMEMNASYDSYRKKSFLEGFDSFNMDLIADGGDKWQLGLGWRFSKDSSRQLTTETSCRIGPKWKVRTYHRYEFEGSKLQEREYGIARDLHCWVAELTYNIRDAETIWLAFRLKAYPDLPLEVETMYHEPKIGSQAAGWNPRPTGRRLLREGF